MPFSYGFKNGSLTTNVPANNNNGDTEPKYSNTQIESVTNPTKVGNITISSVYSNPFANKTKISTQKDYDGLYSQDIVDNGASLTKALDKISPDIDTTGDPLYTCVSFLESLGCSVSIGGKDFSLISQNTYAPSIDNVNLQTRLPPGEAISANKSFPSENDSFYKPDKQKSDSKINDKRALNIIETGFKSLEIANYIVEQNNTAKKTSNQVLSALQNTSVQNTNVYSQTEKVDNSVTSLLSLGTSGGKI